MNCLSKKKMFFAVSISIIVIGLIAFIAFGGLNINVDGAAGGVDISTKELISNIFSAICYALFLMLIYISFRFDLSSGFSAVLVVLHNVLILLAVYAIFRIPVSSSFAAVVLTVVGYSIINTIIVFDKIRENFKTDRKAAIYEVLNKSLNQTFAGTLFLSLAAVLILITMYVLGISLIHDFALPAIIGIVVVTYASVCITIPLWSLIKGSDVENMRKTKRA